jgi:hypothetical protein
MRGQQLLRQAEKGWYVYPSETQLTSNSCHKKYRYNWLALDNTSQRWGFHLINPMKKLGQVYLRLAGKVQHEKQRLRRKSNNNRLFDLLCYIFPAMKWLPSQYDCETRMHEEKG